MFEEVSKNRRFGYARVSSQTQKDNSSLEAQKQQFIQYGEVKSHRKVILLCYTNSLPHSQQIRQ